MGIAVFDVPDFSHKSLHSIYNHAIDNAIKVVSSLKGKGWADPDNALGFAVEQLEKLKNNG